MKKVKRFDTLSTLNIKFDELKDIINKQHKSIGEKEIVLSKL